MEADVNPRGGECDESVDKLSTFEQLRLLGKGGCAHVFLVKNKLSGK